MVIRHQRDGSGATRVRCIEGTRGARRHAKRRQRRDTRSPPNPKP